MRNNERPLSMIGLVIMIITGFVKSIPKLWKSILIRTLISFLVVMTFNFYTIAIKNEGFGGAGYTFGTFWGDMSNLKGNNVAFTTICFVLTYVLTMIVSQIQAKGFKVFLSDVIHVFPWIMTSLTVPGKKVPSIMLITMGFSMIIGILTKNEMLLITLMLTFFFELVAKEKGLVGAVSMAVWNDFHRIAKRKVQPIPPLNPLYVGTITLSLLFAVIILYIIPMDKKSFISTLLMIVFIGIGLLLSWNIISKSTAKNIIVFVLINLVYYRVFGYIFADDGGWHEGGGNPKDYLNSAGAKEVIGSGVTPAVGSIIGGWLGSAVSTATGALKWTWGFTKAVAEDVGYVVKETAIGIKDLAVDAVTGGQLIKETLNGSYTEVKDLLNSGYELGKDGIDWIDKNVTIENIKQLGEDAIKLAGDGIDAIKAEGEEFINDPEKYIGDKIESGIEFVENAGTLAGELSVKAEKLIEDMLEAGEDPRKVWDMVKKILPTDSINGMIDPKSPLALRLVNAGFAIIDAGQLIFTGGAGNLVTEG